jgi:hypothetical protein
MDSGILATLSALAGTAIGALSSLGKTWMTTNAQARAARVAAERAKREDVYGRFMDELARLYASALNNVGIDYERLTTAYALSGRIALYASQPVADAADRAMRYVVDLALGPARSAEEMRAMMEQSDANVIAAFASACRRELADIG